MKLNNIYFDGTEEDDEWSWKYFALAEDAELTPNARMIKEAMWVGYRIAVKEINKINKEKK